MNEEMTMDAVEETPDSGNVSEVPAEPETDEYEGIELEDMPLFGGGEEETSQDATTDDSPEDRQETPPEEMPQETIEINGQAMTLEEIGKNISFGERAARETLRLQEENARLQEENALFEHYARVAGMTREQYVSALRQNLERVQVEKEAQMQGIDPDALWRQRQQEQLFRQRQQMELQAQQQRFRTQQREQEARIAPFRELITRYPELADASKMPPEVAQIIRQGVNPVIAYQDYLLRQQQAQTRIAQQKQAAARKSPGSAAGTGGEAVDEAVAAFMSVFD